MASEKIGYVDGPALEAKFGRQISVTVDPRDGTLYISDKDNHVIRKLSPEGTLPFAIFFHLSRL